MTQELRSLDTIEVAPSYFKIFTPNTVTFVHSSTVTLNKPSLLGLENGDSQPNTETSRWPLSPFFVSPYLTIQYPAKDPWKTNE